MTFFRGASLEPLPPGTSKNAEVRADDIHEGEDRFDETRFITWVEQANVLPGEYL